MATLPSDPRPPSPPPALPDLTEWMGSALLWLADEMSRRAEGHMTSPWMSAEEAAAYIGIHHDSFRKFAKHVPRHRYSEKGWRYHRDELDAWLRADANRYWEDT